MAEAMSAYFPNRPYPNGKTIWVNINGQGGNYSMDKGKTPTPRLPWACDGVLPLHSTRLWLGYIPTPYPFWVGGSPGRSGIFPADQQVPGVAIVGNINSPPSHGTPGSLAGAPSCQMARGRMHTCGKILPWPPPLLHPGSRSLVNS